MQILTKKQVKYCRLVTEQSTTKEYCLGIHFQDKLFVADKFFAGDRQQEAIDYCQNKYLTDGGNRAYILLTNMAGLTVWQEDKTARIVGVKSPEDFVLGLKLNSLLGEVRDVVKTAIGDRYSNSKIDCLLNSLETSLQKTASLEQKLSDGQ